MIPISCVGFSKNLEKLTAKIEFCDEKLPQGNVSNKKKLHVKFKYFSEFLLIQSVDVNLIQKKVQAVTKVINKLQRHLTIVKSRHTQKYSI